MKTTTTTTTNPPSVRIIRDRMEADRFNVNIDKLTATSNKKFTPNKQQQQQSPIKKSKSIAAAASSAVSSWSLAGKLRVTTTTTHAGKSTTQTARSTSRASNPNNQDDEDNLESNRNEDMTEQNMRILKKLKSKSFLSQIRSVKQNLAGGVASNNNNTVSENHHANRLLSNSRLLKKRSSMRKGGGGANKKTLKASKSSVSESVHSAANKSASVTTDIKIISSIPINSKAYRHYIAGNGNKSDKLTNSVEVKNVLRQETSVVANVTSTTPPTDETTKTLATTTTISFVGGNERGKSRS